MVMCWRFFAAVTISCWVAVTVNASHSCLPSESGSARLSGLNSSYVGYVQVCKDGVWTAISFEEDEWTKKNSIVACKELGFLGAIKIVTQDGSSLYPPMTTEEGSHFLPSWQYYSVACTGLEQNLVDCTWTIRNVRAKKKDAMVLCRREPPDGDVAVVGVNGEDSEGIVLLYNPLKSYSWSSICATEWDDLDAEVACKQLGFKGGSSTSYSSEQEVRHNYLPRKRYSQYKCVGSESSLSDCPHLGPYPYQCDDENYAGIKCSGEGEDNTILNLNIALLSFMILISLLLIVILSLLLRCTLNRFRKKHPSRQNRENGREEESEGRIRSHIIRTHLDHEMPYAMLSTIAPPSYEDTILADEVVQQGERSAPQECDTSTAAGMSSLREEQRASNSSVDILLPETAEDAGSG